MKAIKSFIPLFAVSLSFLFGGCSSSKNASGNRLPDWVLNPSREYNEQQYLMAVGSGNTLNDARSDAFANLSQIFQVEVDAEQNLYTEVIDQDINNRIYSESTSELLNNVRLGTNQELMNTTILDSEIDANGTYYALAAMDRSETSRIYSQEISNNEMRINRIETNAGEETNILQKLMLLTQARSLAAANVVLTKQLNIIRGGAGTGDFATRTHARLQEKVRTVQQSAGVTINSRNATETVRSAVASVLQDAGFNITGSNGDAILSAAVNFQRQRAELNRDDAEFVKWELVITLQDLESDRSFQTFMAEGRDGAPSYSDALKRADFSARNKIEKDFYTFLNNELMKNE
ncbi:LPP20 family lipoprotein [Gracilimonas tropica]|uniref:LPP20 family lipoprotein n=1 Tax=Gracilimonas tropica TaxID=454600 RepID=UPI0003744F6F|nr:LPP20 family lipoprotein [Gracilimonas tropica]